MNFLNNAKAKLAQLVTQLRGLLQSERIHHINQKIAFYPEKLRAKMPVWSHRFIDPIKPYMENPKYVWRISGAVILLLLTFITYRSVHDSNQHHFKQVPVVEYDEIEAPQGGFNPEYVRSVKVHAEQVDDHLLVPGRLAYDQDEIRKIAARVSGRVERLFIHEGYFAKRGQPILSVYSPEFLTAEREYLLANSSFGIVSSMKDSGLMTDARDLSEAARNKLMLLGMDEEEIARLKKTGTPLPLLLVKSPIDGMVIDHTLSPGSFVNIGQDMSTVVSLETVWFKGNVYEQDITRVKVGQPLVIKSDAYPGMEFPGEVDFVAPGLDPATHTLLVRATMQNKNGLLKPDVYVNGVITIGTQNRVVIPKEALIKEGNNAYVIQVLPGNHYKLRNVSIAPMGNEETVSILRGLNDGDEIVSLGSVLVYDSIKRKIR